MIQLTERMDTIAGLVTRGNRLADVGTDHGFIPIFLVQRGIVPHAIAMDVRQGPLLRAREHIRMAGLTDRIETRLSDGVQELKKGEADTVVIAGMGGPLIRRILAEGEEVLRSVAELIVSPQSELRAFRAFLLENRYRIAQEKMLCEDGKYYTVMRVLPEKETGAAYGEEELLFGRNLLQEKNPVLLSFLKWEERVQTQILECVSGVDTQAGQKRRRECQEMIKRIREAIAYFDR